MKNFKKVFCIIMALLTIMTFSGNLTSVKASKLLPKITFVGVEHSPLVEGDTETFYITSQYIDRVQYRIFLYNPNGKYEELTNGYSNSVDPGAICEVKPSKIFTRGKYTVIVLVKRADTIGEYSDTNGEFDNRYTLYLNCTYKDDKNRVYVNNSFDNEREIFALGEKIKIQNIKGISGMKSPYKYKLHIYDVQNDVWQNNVTPYSYGIEWKPQKANKYVLDVWVTSSDSKARYEAWKLKPVTVEDCTVFNKEGQKSYNEYCIPEKSIAVFAKNVEISTNTFNKNFYILADNVTLKNVNIRGCLIIDPGVGGKVNLENVKAQEIKIYSGNASSMNFDSVSAEKLYISSKASIGLNTSGATNIDNMLINSDVALNNTTGTISSLNILDNGVYEPKIQLTGNFNTVIAESACSIKTVNTTNIEEIKFSPKSKKCLTLSGEFKNVVSEKMSYFYIIKGSKVQKFIARANADITIDEDAYIFEIERNGYFVNVFGRGNAPR